MNKDDAEKAIIARWRALPEPERQTELQASSFAVAIENEYPFRHSGSDRSREIFRMIYRHQSLIREPLKGSGER